MMNMKKIALARGVKSFVKTCVRCYTACSTGGPLAGVRICDMTRVLTGPYCTMVLGDMGAEVVKVERPGLGDDTRSWGPPFVGDQSCYFLSINRNKKGVCIDIKQEEGKNILYELVKKSDVFIENFVPGKLSELGFGYEQLKEINPKLIYASISGFGSHGPYHQKPGYDVTASAFGGLLSITGPKDGEPCRPGVAITDIMTGMYVLDAIVAALYQRLETGDGKNISSSLLQTQTAMLSHVGTSVLNTDCKPKKYGTAHPSIVPYQTFKTLDGLLAVAATNNNDFNKLCKVLECEDISKDRKFDSNAKRVENRDILIPELEKRFKERSSECWFTLLNEQGISSSLVHSIKEAYDLNMETVLHIKHPTSGFIKVPGPAVNYGHKEEPLPPPLLGEQTCQVLKDILHFTEDQINSLIKKEIIQT